MPHPDSKVDMAAMNAAIDEPLRSVWMPFKAVGSSGIHVKMW